MSVRCRQCGWPYSIGADGLCPSCRQLAAHPDKLSSITHLGHVPFKDMKQMDETERLKFIADILSANPGKAIAVLVDTGEGHEDKGDRYIKAIRSHLPTVHVINRKHRLVPKSEIITFKL